MLHRHISQFLDYCKLADFSIRSIQALSARLNEFEKTVHQSQGYTSRTQTLFCHRNVSSKRPLERHLKNQRHNCGASINRKIFTLRSYANYLKVFEICGADTLPFHNVLKIGSGYRKQPHALTPQQIIVLLEQIDTHTILGIRDYALYALMYQLGLRVGEVHGINLQDIDLKKNKVFLAIYLLEVLNLISILL